MRKTLYFYDSCVYYIQPYIMCASRITHRGDSRATIYKKSAREELFVDTVVDAARVLGRLVLPLGTVGWY